MGLNFKLSFLLLISMLITEICGVFFFYLGAVGVAFVTALIVGNQDLGSTGFFLAFLSGVFGVIVGIILTPIIFIKVLEFFLKCVAKISRQTPSIGSVIAWIIIALGVSALLQAQVWDKLIEVKNIRYGLTFVIFNLIFFVFVLRQILKESKIKT